MGRAAVYAMPTAQNVVNVYVWIGFREELPGADDTVCRIDQSAVHIKQPWGQEQLGVSIGGRKDRRTGHRNGGWCQPWWG